MKKLFVFILCFIGFFVLELPTSHASETDLLPEHRLFFDLDTDTKQKLEYIENGETVQLEIEKEPSYLRINNGSYKVQKSVAGKWHCLYYVSIASNKITNANRLSLNIYSGSASSQSLTFNSTSALCSFKYKYGLVTTTANIRATLSNNQLIVS